MSIMRTNSASFFTTSIAQAPKVTGFNTVQTWFRFNHPGSREIQLKHAELWFIRSDHFTTPDFLLTSPATSSLTRLPC